MAKPSSAKVEKSFLKKKYFIVDSRIHAKHDLSYQSRNAAGLEFDVVLAIDAVVVWERVVQVVHSIT